MKSHQPSTNTGVISIRTLAIIIILASLPLVAMATAPAWWSSRNVLQNDRQPNDYGPINQGQLKNVSRAAAAELDAQLPGGAGDAVHNLISSWSTPAAGTNDFAAVNVG